MLTISLDLTYDRGDHYPGNPCAFATRLPRMLFTLKRTVHLGTSTGERGPRPH